MAELSLDALFSPQTVADPYPMYRQLRENQPVLELPDANLLVLTRYADVQAVLRSKQMGHDNFDNLNPEEQQRQLENPAIANLSRTMLLMNPPDHTRLRSLVVKAFDAKRVEAMRLRIRNLVHRLIDDFASQGAGDLKSLLTHPLPVIVICEMLGIPEADQAQFVQGTKISGRLVDPTPMTEAELETANANSRQSAEFFTALCDARRAEPQDDLTTALVQSESEHGKLSQAELTANIGLLFAAGHETTVNLLGNALIALHRNPEQLALLKADPTLMPNAVEEFLRYDSSVQLSARYALEHTEIAGIGLPKGRRVITLLGAANRDPEAYEDPETLDITRQRNKPLSFGGGIHLCLGAQLARIETAETLNVLFERLPNLRLDNANEPKWRTTVTLRGVTELPAHW